MILFNFETNFKFKGKNDLKKWLNEAIKDYDKVVGEISIIFVDDPKIYEVNMQFLNHDFFTDVITFDYCSKQIVSGDLFISIDRVKENASLFNTSFKLEFLRVIIHGVLHLLGYEDSSDTLRNKMRIKENFYLDKIDLNKIIL